MIYYGRIRVVLSFERETHASKTGSRNSYDVKIELVTAQNHFT